MLTAIIQARLGSSRLPRKVMAEIEGQPMLAHVVSRVSKSELIDLVVVATTVDAIDDEVEAWCKGNQIQCYRGSIDDVLDRYYHTALQFHTTDIVRVTADCPLIDPGIIDLVVRAYQENKVDYASNINPPTFPDGLDVEVFSINALKSAWQNAELPSEREHVTPYIRNHPEIFASKNVHHEQDLSHLRWTVDEPDDLEFVRTVFAQIGAGDFGINRVMELLSQRKELQTINAKYKRNEGYDRAQQQDRASTGTQ